MAQDRSPSLIIRPDLISGCCIIALQRNNSAHLRRPCRATSVRASVPDARVTDYSGDMGNTLVGVLSLMGANEADRLLRHYGARFASGFVSTAAGFNSFGPKGFSDYPGPCQRTGAATARRSVTPAGAALFPIFSDGEVAPRRHFEAGQEFDVTLLASDAACADALPSL
jgi:hypothetical protein